MTKTCLIMGTSVDRLPFRYYEDDELCVRIKLKIAETVAFLASEEVTSFITDCEYGIPLWSTEVILAQKIYSLKVNLEVYSPYEHQADGWVPNWCDRYFAVHEKCDRVRTFDDYEWSADEMFAAADMLIYVGNDTPQEILTFRNGEKVLKRIRI